MNDKTKIADLLPDIRLTLDLASESGAWLLRHLLIKAQATGELPTPASNIDQDIAWQAWRARVGLPPDDGRHDAEPWHSARFGTL